MKILLILGIICFSSLVSAQSIFSCTQGNWIAATSGTCSVQQYGNPGFQFFNNSDSSVSSSNILLQPNGAGHGSSSLIYYYAVNVQAFTSTFTFVPNGVNIAFTLNNTNNLGGAQGQTFVAGAGCEGGFYQAFVPPEPNNVFALELDQISTLSSSAVWPFPFSYSSAQIYQASQSPCIPPYNSDYTPSKISTSPVPLNSPATTVNTTTGDTYSATVIYDGSNFTLNLYDITAGGTCTPTSSSTCFHNVWTSVNIPSIVGSMNTAYVGLTAGTDGNTVGPLWVYNFSYTVNSGGNATAPTCTPGSGVSSSSITVTCSNSNSGTTIMCYTENGTTPVTNGAGTGCSTGTSLSGSSNTITINSTVTTLNVVAGTSTLSDSTVSSYGAYTINTATTNSGLYGKISGGSIH
jgi:hypothetical protein